MSKVAISLVFLITSISLFSQVQSDLTKSVPLWMEFDSINEHVVLKWIGDETATSYFISEPSVSLFLTPIATLDGSENEYVYGAIENGQKYNVHIRKNNEGRGIITFGQEIPVVHNRGRCLLTIDDILVEELNVEVAQTIQDLTMDGWEVDTLHISQDENVAAVKLKVSEWYDSDFDFSQSLFLLGHIPVPYSGNSAYDGHTDHQGAWSSDTYYGDVDGSWTDFFVNNDNATRADNKNIPGDGKFDQSVLPSEMEIEVGRVDFHNLPAFSEDEVELTRKYLIKLHDYKLGNKDYPRRALVENNFGGFSEGFGQSGWRNFPTMFKGENVSVQNYEVELETNKYLFSYACGGGSYTSCSGVGTTQNLWVEKEIQSIFTMNFGSYFGDWDSQNNFLRSALASGDVLSNTWAGRPVWHLYDMALGMHIGHCAKLTQDASGSFYNAGIGTNGSHITLLGDPTLRLHSLNPPESLGSIFDEGDIILTWNPSTDGIHSHIVYRRIGASGWEYLDEVIQGNEYIDVCVDPNVEYDYMVKAVRLEQTGSGSYYNTSLGITSSIMSGENPNISTYFADFDMDGYGDGAEGQTSCTLLEGYVENNLDCDDTNPLINPEMIEIPNNGVDEDCDGEDLITNVDDLYSLRLEIYPNPTTGQIMMNVDKERSHIYELYDAQGRLLNQGELKERMDLSSFADGIFWLRVNTKGNDNWVTRKIQLIK